MQNEFNLTIYEEIVLLALDDEKGSAELGSMFTMAMGGAVLAELAMEGAIAISSDKKKHVTIAGPFSSSDSLLTECLAMIADQQKTKGATHWAQKFAGIKDLKNRVARQLVDKGILREDQKGFLGIFKWAVFPEADHRPEQAIIKRMEAAIFTYTQEVEYRTIVLIALAQATSLLKKVFDKKALKERKQRLAELTSGEVVGKATKEAVEAVQAAIAIAAIMPAVIVTTTS